MYFEMIIYLLRALDFVDCFYIENILIDWLIYALVVCYKIIPSFIFIFYLS